MITYKFSPLIISRIKKVRRKKGNIRAKTGTSIECKVAKGKIDLSKVTSREI